MIACLLAAAAFAAVACGKKPADGKTGHDTGNGSGTAVVSATPDARTATAPPDASGGGGSMSDFKPYLAFRDHAAKVLGVAPDELDGGARDAATAATGEQTVGGAWSYALITRAQPTRDARGWVTADAVVITPDQNLGKLFEEAGVWTDQPIKTADQLAELLTWSYGMSYGVQYPGPTPATSKFPPPSLKMKADGTGTFSYTMFYREPGPGGGAGGGPTDKYTLEVKLTADHQAKLTRSPYTP